MRKLLSFIVLTAAVLLSAATAGCSGTPQEEVAKQAMECLKNGDAEGYVETTLDAIPARGRLIVKELEKNHNGIKSYKLKKSEPYEEDDSYWFVTFEITDGNGKTFDGDISLKKDENGEYRVNDVVNWYR